MPNLIDRLKQNAPGPFYVDASCTDCDLCRSLAPAFFVRDDEIGYSIVHRQPVTAKEVAEAEEAMQRCPSESIGNDGAAASS
jgi:ferredoxin